MAGEELAAMSGGFLALFIVLIVWTSIWKGIALWRAGRNKDIVWFVFMFVLNTAGILPLVYVLFFSNKKKVKKKK